jgi:predicted TIM-barrel fold metal-dependent hydrolase
MIVDAHTHLLDRGHWPNEWWQWVAEDWASRSPDRTPAAIRDRIEDGLIDPDGTRMIANMDAAGVDLSVVLPIDWGPGFTGTQSIEQVVHHALTLAERHRDRLIPFAGIDPRRHDAEALVETWIGDGAKGLKLYPSCGWDPGSSAARAVYTVAEAHRLPVLFHTGDPLPVLDRARSAPQLLDEVARDYPHMPIWLGHAGAPRWWDEALALATAHENVRLEMSVWIWDDSDTTQQELFLAKVAEALRALGPERILFGTDHVSGSRVRAPGFLSTVTDFYRELPQHLLRHGVRLDDSELADVMGRNALRDLGLDRSDRCGA